MPILGLLGTILVGALFWYLRNRGAVGTVEDIAEIASEARNAPRRIRFKRSANMHPVSQCEHPDELIAALSASYLELSGLPSKEEQIALTSALGREFNLDLGQSEELLSYGRWLMGECGSPSQAIARIGKHLYKTDKGNSFPALMSIIGDISSVTGSVSDKQSRALQDLRRDFRIK